MRIVEFVRDFVRKHELFQRDTRVLVAVSGGSDSVALAHLMSELAAAGEARLVGVAHFNHQLRESARRDESFAASVAASLGVPVDVERGDVRGRARQEHRSIEDAARQSRYEFLERARLRLGADRVAVGHTRDDQAETLLLRLVRGAGPRGLAGIHPRHGAVVRPLLDCRRQDLRAYLEERGLTYLEDETNADVSIPRNRVRAELLPLLAERFNPAVVDVLADEATLMQELWAWLEKGDGSLFREKGDGSLSVLALRDAPPPLRRLAVWRAMTEAAGERAVSFRHVELVLDLLQSGRDAVLDLPGHQVQRIGARLVFTGRPPGAVGRPVHRANLFEYSLSIPGEVSLPEADCVVSVEPATGSPASVLAAGEGQVAVARRDLCAGPLVVRNRRPGDRFRPFGLDGTKKLQDFFVDHKVARVRRDQVPVVVDRSGRIVWVAGYGLDEAFRVTDPSQGMIVFRLKRLGRS